MADKYYLFFLKTVHFSNLVSAYEEANPDWESMPQTAESSLVRMLTRNNLTPCVTKKPVDGHTMPGGGSRLEMVGGTLMVFSQSDDYEAGLVEIDNIVEGSTTEEAWGETFDPLLRKYVVLHQLFRLSDAS